MSGTDYLEVRSLSVLLGALFTTVGCQRELFGIQYSGIPLADVPTITGRGGHSFTFIPSLRISTPSPNQGTSLRIWLRVFNPQFQNGYHELRPNTCRMFAIEPESSMFHSFELFHNVFHVSHPTFLHSDVHNTTDKISFYYKQDY